MTSIRLRCSKSTFTIDEENPIQREKVSNSALKNEKNFCLYEKTIKICKNIQAKTLPIVSMTLRHVNLSARLHTNETYESYFKRRIAHIVSTYCEQQINECPGTTLRLDKVPSNSHYSSRGAFVDDDERLLTQENVIVLSVHTNTSANTTTIGFVITKAKHVGSLNELMVVDALKVKYILSAQLAPLSRVLGGIRIDRIDVVPMRRIPDVQQADNTKLLILLTATGSFLLVTYIIATIKVCRYALYILLSYSPLSFR